MAETNGARRPNILLITSDQHRGDCYGFAGRGVWTPHLDMLRRDGTWLRNCITPSPVCQPARCSILTGMLPLTHGVRDNGINLDPELGEVGFAAQLVRAGYASAFVGKAHFSAKRNLQPTGTPECRFSSREYDPCWHGPYMGFEHLDLMVHGNFHRDRPPTRPPAGQHFESWFFSRGKGDEALELWRSERDDGVPTPKTWHSLLPPAWHSSTWVGDRTIDYLRNRNRGKPFVLWASFVDPHYAFDCPLPWSLLHDPATVAISPTHRRDFSDRPWYHEASLTADPKAADPEERKWRLEGSRMPVLSDPQLRKLTANYFGMISLIDHNVGRILSVLRDEDIENNTIVVFTSDHGELLGDHGLYQKGPALYDGLLRVGAIVKGPGVIEGGTVLDPVSTLDLAATFSDYAGLPPSNGTQGRSLRPLLEGHTGACREVAYNEWRMLPGRTGIELDLRTVRTRRYRLSVDLLSGAGEFYDLEEDPLELSNLFDDPARAALRGEMLDMVAARPGTIRDPQPEPTAPGGS
jgi:arylsulfatase A-like enzyme